MAIRSTRERDLWAQFDALQLGSDWNQAANIQQVIDRLMDIYAVGSPFIPFIKRAVSLRGLPVGSAVSFPFPAVTAEQEQAVRDILHREGLLNGVPLGTVSPAPD